jgi:hypothetical protein
MTRTYARYLAGWAIVTALLIAALTTVVPGVAGESGPAAAIAGVLVCAGVDLVTFALVLKALDASQERFARLWGLSIFLKILVLGSSIALVAARGWFPVDGFVRVLITSFVVFAHHEVLWLALRRAPRPAGAASC